MKTLKEYKAEQMKNPEFAAAYEEVKTEMSTKFPLTKFEMKHENQKCQNPPNRSIYRYTPVSKRKRR